MANNNSTQKHQYLKHEKLKINLKVGLQDEYVFNAVKTST